MLKKKSENHKQIKKAHDKKLFKEYTKFMYEGIKRGSKDYGDYSYADLDMIQMIKEEIRDQGCYSFFMYSKIVQLEKHIMKLKDLKEVRDGKK